MASLVAYLLAALAFATAADELARGFLAAPDVLLSVHLLVLGFLPLAVAGAALHVLPVFLRATPRPAFARLAFALLLSGPVLAVAVARHVPLLAWPCLATFAAGVAILIGETIRLVRRAPAGKLLLVSRFGVLAATGHGALSIATGPVLFAARWREVAGIPHERLIAIHLHLAVVGCLTLLIVTVGRTLVPMLALAPSAPRRRAPVEELLVASGTWVTVVGLTVGSSPVVAAGAIAVAVGAIRFAGGLARTFRSRRTPNLEAPLAHTVVGIAFLLQAGVLSVFLFGGNRGTAEVATYGILLLVGWSAGATLGHVGRLLALSAWTWWPPGERPRQAAFFARGLWTAETVAFALGVELLAAGTLLGAAIPARAGGGLLVVSGVLAVTAAARTTWTPAERSS